MRPESDAIVFPTALGWMALAVYGQRWVTDTGGRRHPWARDLAMELSHRQEPSGAWVNRNPRWLEDNPVLVTAYALLALSRCTQALETS